MSNLKQSENSHRASKIGILINFFTASTLFVFLFLSLFNFSFAQTDLNALVAAKNTANATLSSVSGLQSAYITAGGLVTDTAYTDVTTAATNTRNAIISNVTADIVSTTATLATGLNVLQQNISVKTSAKATLDLVPSAQSKYITKGGAVTDPLYTDVTAAAANTRNAITSSVTADIISTANLLTTALKTINAAIFGTDVLTAANKALGLVASSQSDYISSGGKITDKVYTDVTTAAESVRIVLPNTASTTEILSRTNILVSALAALGGKTVTVTNSPILVFTVNDANCPCNQGNGTCPHTNNDYCSGNSSVSLSAGYITLRWRAFNAGSCKATASGNSSNWSGAKSSEGAEQIFSGFPGSIRYTMTCVGNNGSPVSSSVNVNVAPTDSTSGNTQTGGFLDSQNPSNTLYGPDAPSGFSGVGNVNTTSDTSCGFAGTANFQILVGKIIRCYITPIAYLIVSFAVVIFIYGVFKFIGAEGEEKNGGKELMFWGIVGLFVMISLWGLVSVLQVTIRL